MKKTSVWAIVAVIAAVAILAVLRYGARPVLSDEEQIHVLLAKGQTAFERKDMKAAMSCVSRTYKDPSGTNVDHLRVQIIQAFQQDEKYDVVLENTKVSVNADVAEVITNVTVGAVSQGRMHQLFSAPMTIRLVKEKSMHWLVFPVMEWKAISMEGMPSGFTE